MATSRAIKDIARALIAVANDQKAVPEVMRSLNDIRTAFRQDPQLAIDLDETSVPLTQRQAALKKGLKETHALVLNALLALQTRGLLTEIQRMADTALTEAAAVARYREATVTVAQSLTKKELTEITGSLEKKFGGTVTVEQQLDPCVLGGIKITIGDWQHDSTTKGKLTRLAHALYV